MTALIPVGLIGADDHVEELRRHVAPVSGIRIARFAPASSGADRVQCTELAGHFGAEFAPDWREVTNDPRLPALLVFGPAAVRTEIVIAGLTAGKLVLCPFPVARDAALLAAVAEARTKGSGMLLTLGEIAGTAAGTTALDALRSGRLGKLHSIWAATRDRRSSLPQADVVEQYGWPILDFLLTAIDAPPVRLHARLAHLFEPGPHADTAVILLRFDRETVVTIELSRCLPPSMSVPPTGEVEIECIGAHEVVRIEPYNTSVRIYAETGVSIRPWVDGAVVNILPQVVAAVHSGKVGGSSLRRNEFAVSIMERIRSSH